MDYLLVQDHSSVRGGTESIRMPQYSTIQETCEHFMEETIQNKFIVKKQSQHQQLVTTQHETFNQQVNHILKKECVIVLDFTCFHETVAFKLRDLCFIIYFRGSDGQLRYEWIDFFFRIPT
jgi:hypothetical protein